MIDTTTNTTLTSLPYPTATVRDFIVLLKPRVVSLVGITGLAGILMAPQDLHPVLMITAILCLAISAGGSGAINMWYDHDIDTVMTRTRLRPIPQGRISREDALNFGIFLICASVCVMGLAVNWIAALLLLLASMIYVFIYTIWLKRRTPHNIVIGGAAGALAPLIGWAAVTGDISVAGILLFLIIFVWTPSHFWSLSLLYRDDYERAGIPMMPVAAGEEITRRYILIYALLLWPVTMAPVFFGLGGLLYPIIVVIFGSLYIFLAIYLNRKPSRQIARHMFTLSILYLFLLFTVLISSTLIT